MGLGLEHRDVLVGLLVDDPAPATSSRREGERDLGGVLDHVERREDLPVVGDHDAAAEPFRRRDRPSSLPCVVISTSEGAMAPKTGCE